MGGVLDWSTTPDSNTTVDGVSIAEGMQAGLVNNGMRAIMALVRHMRTACDFRSGQIGITPGRLL